MRPSASIGSTVAGIRPFRSSVMSISPRRRRVDSNRFLPAGEAPFRRCAASRPAGTLDHRSNAKEPGWGSSTSSASRAASRSSRAAAARSARRWPRRMAGAGRAGRGRRPDRRHARGRGGARPRGRAPRAWRSPRMPPRGRRRSHRRRDASRPSGGSTSSSTPSAAGPAQVLNPAEAYPRDAWDWIMELNVRSTIVPDQAVARAMIEQGDGGAVLNITSVRAQPRHQRRVLGLRRGQGRDRVADPAVGDRVGEVRHPRQRDHADVRRHARRSRRCSATRRSRPASSTGSRSAAWARPATSSAPRSSCARTPRRSSPGQVLGIDGGLTATQ